MTNRGKGAQSCAQPPEINGNVRRQGSYSYHRGNGGVWCIYKATGEYSGTKYAEVVEKGEDGRLQAAEIVSALNARERYKATIDYNKQQ